MINHLLILIKHKFIIKRKTNQDLRRNKVHEENSIKSVGNNQGIFNVNLFINYLRDSYFFIITNKKIKILLNHTQKKKK